MGYPWAGLAAFVSSSRANIFPRPMTRNFPRLAGEHVSGCVAQFGAVVEHSALHPADAAWATRGWPSGTGRRYSIWRLRGERGFAFQLVGLSLLALLMASSRMVAIMPPWAWRRADEASGKREFADVTLAVLAERKLQLQPAGICRTHPKQMSRCQVGEGTS